MTWRNSFKHAFSVESPEDINPSDDQRAVIDKLCLWIVRRRMTTPATLALEVGQPLNYVASQAMHFFRPAVAALLDTREYRLFAEFLEHRGAPAYLVNRLSELEDACRKHEAGEGPNPADSVPHENPPPRYEERQ